MKIGILTLPLNTNYGGILQAFALQTVLERMGHEIIILDKSPYKHLPLWKMPITYSKRIIKKYIFRKKIRIFYEYWYNKSYPIISQYTQRFIEDYIYRKEINNLSKLEKDSLDVIIVGSDQIWRKLYYPKIEDAFLEFTKSWHKVKRIAYAASFGTEKWTYSIIQTHKCKALIQKFNAVSVREDSGLKLCKKYFNTNAEHVLDPTMLLDKNDYIHIIEKQKIGQSQGNLLCYILDANSKTNFLIKKIATEKNLIPFYVNAKVDDQFAPTNKRIQPPIEKWLKGFQDADFIITDSFHACVFSIIFNKPFVVYGNPERGISRLKSFLKLFNIEQQLIFDVEKISKEQINFKITPEIQNKLKILREKSFKFLSNALNS